MAKVLTVSVAAYNVARFLRRALDSFVDPRVLEAVEVIVIDDGSGDGTADIAGEYVRRYPQCFTLVRKENGGYGSTLNEGIARASGRYFQPLDGDDWMDPAALRTLVDFLRTCTADMVVSKALVQVQETDGRERRTAITSLPAGREHRLSSLHGVNTLLMFHATVFATAVLQADQRMILEHCFYTDQQFMLHGLLRVRSFVVTGACPYRYRAGADEQSVSVAGYARHYQEGERCYRRMMEIFHSERIDTEERADFLRYYLALSLQGVYGMFLCRPASREAKAELLAFHRYLLAESPDVYARSRAKKVLLLRYSGFLLYRPIAWLYKRTR